MLILCCKKVVMSIERLKTVHITHLEELVDAEARWKITLLSRWQQVIDAIGIPATLEAVHGTWLLLGVTHSCWMQELQGISDQIIGIVNAFLEVPRIERIKFRRISALSYEVTGASARERQRRARALPASSAVSACVQITEQEKKVLSSISDPEMQSVLMQLLRRCKQS